MNPYARALASIIRLIAVACILISALLMAADYLGKGKKSGLQPLQSSSQQQDGSAAKLAGGSTTAFKKSLYFSLEVLGLLAGSFLLVKGNNIAKKLTEDFDG